MGGCFTKQPHRVETRNVQHNTNLELLSIDPNQIPYFTYENTTKTAVVCDVYDGDTCTVIFKDNDELRKYKLRMFGYDSPEMKPKLTVKNREMIKHNAKLAKEALKEQVINKVVRLELMKEDKYGRLLGIIYLDNKNINQWMINNGYGYEYFGGTKRKNQ